MEIKPFELPKNKITEKDEAEINKQIKKDPDLYNLTEAEYEGFKHVGDKLGYMSSDDILKLKPANEYDK